VQSTSLNIAQQTVPGLMNNSCVVVNEYVIGEPRPQKWVVGQEKWWFMFLCVMAVPR
jgi:hypothetical protein